MLAEMLRQVGPHPRRPRRRPPVVGLTGGFASGKSVVREMFHSAGAAVVDADAVTRELSAPGGAVWQAIVGAFGEEVLTRPGGELDRAALWKRICNDREARKRLNAATHPVILAEVRRRVARLLRYGPGRGSRPQRERQAPAVVVEVPLLYEAGRPALSLVDVVVVVWADRETCLRRSVARGLSPEEAALAVEAQWPLERKRRLADFVVDNSGDLDRTRRQVERIWKVMGSPCASRWWHTTRRSRRWSSLSAPFGRFSNAAACWPPAPRAAWWLRPRASR
ncbi:MAG: dephospho-CoA kinase [Bacillota bacterium]